MSRAAIVATFRAGGLLDERSPFSRLFTSPYTLSLQLSPPLLCCAYLWLLSRLSFLLLCSSQGVFLILFRVLIFVRAVGSDGLSVCEQVGLVRLAGFLFLRVAAVSAQRSAGVGIPTPCEFRFSVSACSLIANSKSTT